MSKLEICYGNIVVNFVEKNQYVSMFEFTPDGFIMIDGYHNFERLVDIKMTFRDFCKNFNCDAGRVIENRYKNLKVVY